METTEVYLRVSLFLSDMQKTHADKIEDIEMKWNDTQDHLTYHIKALGLQSKGYMTLHDGHIEMQGSIPFIITALRGRIEKKIRKTLDDLLT